MYTLYCGNIPTDDVMQWCMNNKKFQQADQYACGYYWQINSTIVRTNNDHFLNGLRVAVKYEVYKPEDIDIIFFPKDGENKENGIRIVLDKTGRCDDWPIGFFDQWDTALMELI